jgi:hypothetical protein
VWIAHLRGFWLLPEIRMKMGVVLREKERLARCLVNRALDHRAKRNLKKQTNNGKSQKSNHTLERKKKFQGRLPT